MQLRLLLLPAAVLSHGAMNFPRPRNSNPQSVFAADASCIGEACYWYQVGCFPGCSSCTGTGKYLYAKPSDFPEGCTPSEPTNNKPEHRSWDPMGLSVMGDFTKNNPWRSPGKAPVRDACGASSGYIRPSPYAETPKGYAPWSKGSEVLPEGSVTVWRAGGTAEVAWSIAAQHGGGYSYRLCPKNSSALTEGCFQANPLTFVGTTHTIRHNDGSKPDFEINATQVSEGVTPAGSTWRRNPIPACNCDIGGKCLLGGKGFSAAYENKPEPLSAKVCPTGTMFPAPFDGGAGDVGGLTGHPLHYSIVDRVVVPKEEGEYVLSWRWDCEQTNQVWNSCADIRVSASEPPTPPPPPAPPAPPSPAPKPPPKGKGCKAFENPTCKGSISGKECVYYGCKKCHDDTSFDCDECCDGCTKTYSPAKQVHYCASETLADPLRDDFTAFLEGY